MYLWERKLLKQTGIKSIAGIDEAGRGPLAGPVVVAAVVLKRPEEFQRRRIPKFNNRIADSKVLTIRQREKAFDEIINKSWVGVGISNQDLIDELNVSVATAHAAIKALNNLPQKPEYILADFGIVLPEKYSYTSLVRGESKSLSIACASIVAKVIRDRIMGIYDSIFPCYAFGKHKGYGTKQHINLLKRYGPSPIHRKSFWPVSSWFKG